MTKFHVTAVLVRDVSNAMAARALRCDQNAPAVNMQKALEQHECYIKVFRFVYLIEFLLICVSSNFTSCLSAFNIMKFFF